MTKTRTMPAHQRKDVREMDSCTLCDFQLRLQIECGMTHQESASYVAQAWDDTTESVG